MLTNLKLRNAISSAGATFFSMLLGLSIADAFPDGIWAAGVAAGLAFSAAWKTNGNVPPKSS